MKKHFVYSGELHDENEHGHLCEVEACHAVYYAPEVDVELSKRDKRIAELEKGLRELLDDTQHANHGCGDDDCPVKLARALTGWTTARIVFVSRGGEQLRYNQLIAPYTKPANRLLFAGLILLWLHTAPGLR